MRRAANAWDRFYQAHREPWRGERAVEPLRPWLGDRRVLELGCGNGKALRPLRAAGFDVVGLDISWHALRRLGTGVLADAACLPFHDGSFGGVLDVHCSGHLNGPGRAAALAEVWRVLDSAGHVVVERLGVGDLRASQGSPAGPGARVLADGRTTHFTDVAALRAEVEAAGFHIRHEDRVIRTPRIAGRLVRRESVMVVGQKAR